MKKVKCNLCGADDYVEVFPKGYAQLHRIVRCRHCDLMYANPQEHIDCEEFASQNGAEIYDPNAEVNRQYFQKQQTQVPDNLRALRVLNGALPQRGRLLEIGSYAGIFLDRIRADGWQAVGLEPLRPVARYARAQYGLNIIEGVLPNPALKDAEFDAVVLLHVIEHMPDPCASIREIRRVLKPGGVLVVETPRFDSLMFKLLGRRERSIQNCSGHIYFFTEPTLKQLLEKNRLKVFRIERVGRTLTLDRFMYNVGLVSRSPRVQRFLAGMSRTMCLDKMRLYVNARDMQRQYARAV